MIMLTPFEAWIDEKTSSKWISLPLAVWRSELEMITKDKMFRNAQHLEIMIPLKYCGLWMMFTWNC